jgi:hypothetical protein
MAWPAWHPVSFMLSDEIQLAILVWNFQYFNMIVAS